MIIKQSKDILFDIGDAIINDEFEGFKEDYLVLHSLIRKYRPKDFFEVGTNMGRGTEIICNAVYKYHFDAKVYSLDLPTELAHISLQHPISEGKGDKVGSLCKLPFIQLRGDSMKFDFAQYPCEGYYIDGEHDTIHAQHESTEVFLLNPKIVIWHDTDMKAVMDGILASLEFGKFDYELYRVEDTRISYALRK